MTTSSQSTSTRQENLPITFSTGPTQKFSDFSHVEEKQLFSLSIPDELLFHWYMNKKASESYVSLVNSKISVVRLAQSDRLEQRLAVQACKLASKRRHLKGRKKYAVTNGHYQLYVLDGEAESYEEMETQLVEKAQRLQTLMDEMAATTFHNTGRQVHEVAPRQMKRKLSQCKTFVEQALWFCESFGLKPEFVQLRKQTGSPVKLSISHTLPQQHTNKPPSHTPTDSSRVQQALYILDRFAVSDEAYHELSVTSDLPPLYRIKEARLSINNSLDIRRLQGPYPGAYRPFKPAIKDELTKIVSHNIIMSNSSITTKI